LRFAHLRDDAGEQDDGYEIYYKASQQAKPYKSIRVHCALVHASEAEVWRSVGTSAPLLF